MLHGHDRNRDFGVCCQPMSDSARPPGAGLDVPLDVPLEVFDVKLPFSELTRLHLLPANYRDGRTTPSLVSLCWLSSFQQLRLLRVTGGLKLELP